MQAQYRSFRVIILKQYYWQIALVILAFGFVFSILGVYDTHRLPFYMRFTFWTTTMATGIIASILPAPFISNHLFKDHHPIYQIVLGSFIASIPVTFVLTVFNPTFSFNSSLKIWIIQFGYVLVISLVVGAAGYPFMKKIGAFGADDEPQKDQGAVQVSDFLKRLPIKFHAAELYGFSAEDHYLRVYTNRGEELILLRFADAMKSLSNVEGLQVHRSWWVMKNGVADIDTKAGKRVLILKSETQVPVSRTYSKTVKDTFSPARVKS